MKKFTREDMVLIKSIDKSILVNMWIEDLHLRDRKYTYLILAFAYLIIDLSLDKDKRCKITDTRLRRFWDDYSYCYMVDGVSISDIKDIVEEWFRYNNIQHKGWDE